MIRKVLYIGFIESLICINAGSQDLEGMGFKKGIDATGGINLSTIVYNTNDSAARREPFQMILSGNLNLNIFGYDAPFSFTYSNSQKSYTQPFNRLCFTPQYKWIRAYIGQTSMSFSPYTLSGHSFKGAGVELTPGPLRFALMAGQLRKAVQFDPLKESTSVPSYKRMGYGMKLGYEKGSSGILFNIFSAKDDENSTDPPTGKLFVQPLQNLAAGISARTLVLDRIVLQGEYSLSILKTIRGEIPDDSLTLSSSSSDRKFDAYSLAAGYQSETGSLMIKYERVAPEYQSLGAYYFNNDLENFTLSPTIRLLDGLFSFSGNAGIQRNNLDKSRESTTKRFVGAGTINLILNENLNFSVNYSNFSTYTNRKPLEDPFFRDNMDSLNFYQITNQFGGSVNYAFGSEEAPANLMIFTSFQQANEKSAGNGSGFLTGNISYSKSFSQNNLSMSFNYNLNSSKTNEMNSLYHGPGITVVKSVSDKKMHVSLNSNYNINKVNERRGSPVLSTGLNLNYSPKNTDQGKHNITASLNWVQRFRSAMNDSRRELTGTVNYSYAF
jgi:hypothetical protein